MGVAALGAGRSVAGAGREGRVAVAEPCASELASEIQCSRKPLSLLQTGFCPLSLLPDSGFSILINQHLWVLSSRLTLLPSKIYSSFSAAAIVRQGDWCAFGLGLPAGEDWQDLKGSRSRAWGSLERRLGQLQHGGASVSLPVHGEVAGPVFFLFPISRQPAAACCWSRALLHCCTKSPPSKCPPRRRSY